MSKYTTEVRFLCESLAGLDASTGESSIEDIITNAAPKIFNFSFPIFDENYRLPLERKILRHFYTREISEETVGLWKLRLNDKLNVIMPYYNKLYESELLKFNPFYDVDITREREGSNVGEQSRKQESVTNNIENRENKASYDGVSTGSSTNNKTDSETNWDLYSDTPQSGVEGIEGNTENHLHYLTNARKTTDNATSVNEYDNTQITQHENKSSDDRASTSTGNVDDTTNVTNLEQYVERIVGKQGASSYSELLRLFRKTFLNIDQMILDELENLFFGLW